MTSARQELDLFLQHPAFMGRANPWAGKVNGSVVFCTRVLNGR